MTRIARTALSSLAAMLVLAGAPYAAAQEATQANSAEWVAEEFGTFEPVTFEGAGEVVIELPADMHRASMFIADVTYEGGAKDALLSTTTQDDRLTGLLVDTFLPAAGAAADNSFTGSTALLWNAKPTAKLRIDGADGAWKIALQPVVTAPVLPETGSGWGVFLYDGPKADITLTGTGAEGGLHVRQVTPTFKRSSEVARLQFGQTTGEGSLSAGPSIIIIQHAGDWAIEVSQ